MSQSDTITGGCMCGSVRYEVNGEPAGSRVCHCRDCQRSTGSAFSSNLVVRDDTFRITAGEPSVFEKESDRGNTVQRFFCRDCSSPIYGRAGAFPDLLTVRAGTLDDPGNFRPQAMFFTSRAHAWLHLDEAIEQFPGMPGG
jgi:hypothetical protein